VFLWLFIGFPSLSLLFFLSFLYFSIWIVIKCKKGVFFIYTVLKIAMSFLISSIVCILSANVNIKGRYKSVQSTDDIISCHIVIFPLSLSSG